MVSPEKKKKEDGHFVNLIQTTTITFITTILYSCFHRYSGACWVGNMLTIMAMKV